MNSDTSAADDGAEASDAETRPDAGDEAADDDVTEIASKGRPSVFILLTCGFLVCMCCVGGLFAGGSVGWMRMSNLDEVVTKLDEPDGWQTTDSSSTPWRAEASLSGPADAGALAAWLADAGAKTSEAKVTECLEAAKGCTVELKSGGFPVRIEYRALGDRATATVHVD